MCGSKKKSQNNRPMAMLLQAPQASGVTSPQTILPAGKVDSATRGFFAVVGWKDNRARSGTVPSVQSNCGDTARAWRVPNYPIRRPSVRILPETQSCVPYVLAWCSGYPVFSVTQSLTGPVELLMPELLDLSKLLYILVK